MEPSDVGRVSTNGAPRTAQTQADGSYSFPGLAPGQYTVQVTVPGFASYLEPSAEVKPPQPAGKLTRGMAPSSDSRWQLHANAQR